MSQNIEIEFKNLLTKEEFNKLKTNFQLTDDQFFKQINHYFDTKDFSLKKNGCALRIREKEAAFEMTLKQPHPDGLLETNQRLTAEEAHSFLNGGPIKEGMVKAQIIGLEVDAANLSYFGSLTTERTEIAYKDGLLVLDKSSYLNKEDYEVEYEVMNRNEGMSVFNRLLKELHIPIRQTKNKTQRFYEHKRRLESTNRNKEHES